jgi:hypothetical protein
MLVGVLPASLISLAACWQQWWMKHDQSQKMHVQLRVVEVLKMNCCQSRAMLQQDVIRNTTHTHTGLHTDTRRHTHTDTVQ